MRFRTQSKSARRANNDTASIIMSETATVTPKETAKEKKPTHNEEIKTAIPTLAGTLAATLADPALDRFSDDDQQFMKFHGIYQQDDRDQIGRAHV